MPFEILDSNIALGSHPLNQPCFYSVSGGMAFFFTRSGIPIDFRPLTAVNEHSSAGHHPLSKEPVDIEYEDGTWEENLLDLQHAHPLNFVVNIL